MIAPRALVGRAVVLLVALVAGTACVLGSSGDAYAAKFGKRVLRQGMRGKDVRTLQRYLVKLKLQTPVAGRFGPRTRRSVRSLERRRGWRVDGRVGRIEAKRIKGLVKRQLARKRARRLSPGTYSYVFPAGDPHDFGGAQSRFGAPRSGHAHQGQDVFAPCGIALRAAQGGNVKTRSYQGRGAGHYLVIDGLDGSDTVYMHMKKASWAGVGTLIYPGQQLGRVGQSGNASGCHLHFEHWTYPGWYAGGYPVDPLPELLNWDTYS